ncbi:hypothetical protein [uncultured Microbacterium sp.]|uniref:hypothetical protein n=1 Tax=uncultured Microbacterium sp. TaxID=191216 RepID=UPI00261AB01C|nr:hypothetical protein [uncultured Microbacterium sp.]
MNVAELIVRASARLIRPGHRTILNEAWLADLHYARDAGIAPMQIAAGAFLTAVSPHNLRRALKGASNRRSTFMSPARNTAALLAVWGLWILAALALLNVGVQAWPSPTGSGPYFAFAADAMIPLGPVLVIAAAIGIGVGAVGICVNLFRGNNWRRTSASS